MDVGDKFLPIGTICSIRGNNKNVMITGFFSIDYNGNVIMYDYSGCDYPEGLLLKNKLVSFNHSDIETIHYFGYINDDCKKFNQILNKRASNDEEYNSMDVLSNIKFDSSGVVIYDPVVNQNHESDFAGFLPIKEVSERQQVENPFKVTTVYTDNTETKKLDSDEWSIFKNIEFDGNGVVVSAVEYGIEELKT